MPGCMSIVPKVVCQWALIRMRAGDPETPDDPYFGFANAVEKPIGEGDTGSERHHAGASSRGSPGDASWYVPLRDCHLMQAVVLWAPPSAVLSHPVVPFY